MFDSIVCFWSVPRLEKSSVPGPPRLVVSTIVLSALLSGVAVHQVHAQNNAPIFNWQGEVQVSPSTLTIREGETLAYEVRLSEQPAADGWWLRIHVDGVVYIAGRLEEKGISWVPSVGWQFNREEGKEDSDPTQWRSVRIEALQDDDDDEDEFVTITHEVWDENSNCPPSLHGVAPVEVQVTDDETASTGVALSVNRTTVSEGAGNGIRLGVGAVEGRTLTVDKPTRTFTPDRLVRSPDGGGDGRRRRRRSGRRGGPPPPGQRRGLRDGVQDDSLEVTVDDDDTPGATVSTQSLSVPEGRSKTFTVVLKFQPTATTTVDLTGDPENPDFTVSPSPTTFTRSNWSTAKTVTVRRRRRFGLGNGPGGGDQARFQRRRLRRRDVVGRESRRSRKTTTRASGCRTKRWKSGEGLSGADTVKLDTQPVGRGNDGGSRRWRCGRESDEPDVHSVRTGAVDGR